MRIYGKGAAWAETVTCRFAEESTGTCVKLSGGATSR